MGGFKKNKVEKAFKTKGNKAAHFIEERRKDHIYFYLFINGVDVGIWTKVSHGPGKTMVGDGNLSKMAGQLKIKKQLLNGFVSCTHDCKDIVEVLTKDGVV